MDPWKVSVALLELFCALGFIVCGLVVGFSAGGLLGPALFGHGGQGLEEIGFMLNGAIIGTTLGLLAAALAVLKLPRDRRQRLATGALALAAMTALFTAVAVKRFNGW